MGFFRVTMSGEGPRPVAGDPDLAIRRRIPTNRRETTEFLISEPFGYRHEEPGDPGDWVEVVVPADPALSDTDLASVPSWFGWIAAKTGRNLAAALVHDVLIVETDRDRRLATDELGRPETPVNHWWRTPDHPAFALATEPYQPFDRPRADRVFRDGMRDIGVDPVRRWMMWAAVAAVTLWNWRPRGWRGVVDAARVVVLWALVAAAVLLVPYLLADIVSMPWSWFPDGGDWPADLRDAGLAVAGMTALACAVVGIGAGEKRQWVIGLLVPAAAVFSWAVLATLLGGGLLYVVRLVGGLRRVKRAGYVVAVDPDTGTAVVRVTGARISAGDRLRVGAAEPARAKVRSMEVAEPVAVAAAGPPQPAPLPTDVRVQVDPGTSMEVGDEVFVEQSVSGSRHE